jgi:hypothetical protein
LPSDANEVTPPKEKRPPARARFPRCMESGRGESPETIPEMAYGNP